MNAATDTWIERTSSPQFHQSGLNTLAAESRWLLLLAELAKQEGAAALERLAILLEEGALRVVDPSTQWQRALNVSLERFRLYRDVLREAPSQQSLIIAAKSAAVVTGRLNQGSEAPEVAWTFPGAELSGIRTTGGVSREVVRSSTNTLLVVGYSVLTDPTLTGLAAETIGAIAEAAARGVSITIVLHRNANRNALLRAFRNSIRQPRFYTWPERQDPMAAVHAKVLVSDRWDALVTSANLTYHGFEGNLEIGVRVRGAVAAQIAESVHALITSGHLVSWTPA